MKWRMGRRSGNIEDRRGLGGKAAGGGVGLLALAVIVALMGGDPTALLFEGVNRSLQSQAPSPFTQAEQDEMLDFASVILADTEDSWTRRFAQEGLTYEPPTLVVFSGAVDSACGTASSAVGPFYCPLDRNLYLDLDFFHQLSARHDAPGDFAQAYVIAHEIGHHVQNLTGDLQLEGRPSNDDSVRTELMADCYAGLWAHDTAQKNWLETGDVEEALRAASQIGDDTLQKQSQGFAVPDSFTHGSAEQRLQAFQKGLAQGDRAACRS